MIGLTTDNVSAHLVRLDAMEKQVIHNPELSLSQTKEQKAAKLTITNESGPYNWSCTPTHPRLRRSLPVIGKEGRHKAVQPQNRRKYLITTL